jgi:hypothetical protein
MGNGKSSVFSEIGKDIFSSLLQALHICSVLPLVAVCLIKLKDISIEFNKYTITFTLASASVSAADNVFINLKFYNGFYIICCQQRQAEDSSSICSW